MPADIYTAQFLDTETDEIVDVFTFSAWTANQAARRAQEEAEYHGFHLGTVRLIKAAA